MTCGLRRAGINVIKGIDVDPSVKQTYERNNHGSSFLQADIRKLESSEVMNGIRRRGNVLLFAACAPCQPFSVQFRKNKRLDLRRSLMICFGKIVAKIKPDYILVENVPGFKSDKNPYYKLFKKILKAAGYEVSEGIVNAKDFGIPQNRRRFFLIASLHGRVTLPEQTFGSKLRPHRTVREAISKYPKLRAGQKHDSVPNHQARALSKKNLMRIKSVRKNGGSRLGFPRKLVLNCHKNHHGHTDVYGRMHWDAPSPTLTCKCTSITNGRFGHPEQDRAITVREAAALQTFPENYVFYGNSTDTTKHVGNAVPVLLAEVFGRKICDHDRELSSKQK